MGPKTKANHPRFNPHSSFRPSATLALVKAEGKDVVSILTRAFARVQPIRNWIAGKNWLAFQSSLELSPECNGGMLHLHVPGHIVSILTRAFARVQLTSDAKSEVVELFQSSLELSPECNLPTGVGKLGQVVVSILTRAFARVQRVLGFNMFYHELVSILTRAFARVQLAVCVLPSRLGCFNPHSSFRPSATSSMCAPFPLGLFQSSLELSPECNTGPGGCGSSSVSSFNPHSSFRPSATVLVEALICKGESFNPHSSFRPSATCRASGRTRHTLPVSILTRAFARVQLPRVDGEGRGRLVSILTRAFARVQPS